MRNLTALLFLLSLCSLHLVSSAPTAFEYKDKCCSSITKAKIPLYKILSYSRTGSSCPIKAVIFYTKANKMFCVDPAATWVKNHTKTLDQRKNNTKSQP